MVLSGLWMWIKNDIRFKWRIKVLKLANSFVLSDHMFAVLEGRDVDLVCDRCGEGFEVGDVVVISSSGRRRYHRGCWEGLFV